MKARKRNRLSAANRALINEVDLREPAAVPLTLHDAIREVVVEKRVDELYDQAERDQRSPEEILQALILHNDMERYANLPIEVFGPNPWSKPPTESEPEQDVNETPAPAPPAPQPRAKPPVRRKPVPVAATPLSDEQRQEIVDAYVANMSTVEICAAYNINPPRLYDTLRKAGIALRGREPTKQAMQLPSIDHIPSLNGTSTSVLPTWTVVYTVRRTEQQVVAAASFNDAAAAVQKLGDDDIEVLSVSKIIPGAPL